MPENPTIEQLQAQLLKAEHNEVEAVFKVVSAALLAASMTFEEIGSDSPLRQEERVSMYSLEKAILAAAISIAVHNSAQEAIRAHVQKMETRHET